MQIQPIIFLALMGCTTTGGDTKDLASECRNPRSKSDSPSKEEEVANRNAHNEKCLGYWRAKGKTGLTGKWTVATRNVTAGNLAQAKVRASRLASRLAVENPSYARTTTIEQMICDNLCKRASHYFSRRCDLELDADADVKIVVEGADTVIGQVSCITGVIGKGRPPMGPGIARSAKTTLGAHHASDAREEAASVYAFLQLKAQLAAMSAPEALLDRCAAAAQDEVRHTRTMAGLARAAGSSVQPVTDPGVPRAQPQDIAAFNAMTGCVAESFSALLAAWQAEHASKPELQSVYAQIATDELEHAQLSWDIHAWLMTVVDDPAQVEAALQAALSALPEQAAQMTRPDLPELGLPSAEEMHTLSSAFVRGIQSQLAA